MFSKIKKLIYSLIILVVVAGSFASSFFVYPKVVDAQDVDCTIASSASEIATTHIELWLDESVSLYAANPVSNTGTCPAQEGSILHYYEFTDLATNRPVHTAYESSQVLVAKWDETEGGKFESGMTLTGAQLSKGTPLVTTPPAVKNITMRVYSYRAGSPSTYNKLTGALNIKVYLQNQGSNGPHEKRSIPEANGTTTYEQGEEKNISLGSFGIKTTSYAKEYRIAVGEKVNLRYKLEWEDSTKAPRFDIDTIDVNSALNAGDPTLGAVYAGFNYSGVSIDCLGGDTFVFIDLNCGEGDLFNSKGVKNKGLPAENLTDISIDYSLIGPNLGGTPTVGTAEDPDGTPIDKGFVIFSILDLSYNPVAVAACKSIGGLCLNTDKALADKTVPITIKVYATDKERVASFAKDNLTQDPAHPQEAGGEVSATGTNTTSSVDKGGAGTSIADFLAGIIGDIIAWIQLLIFTIFGIVVLPIITTLISIPTYTDNFAAVILPGWELLRNLSNIFFILVLLVIGLGTLFRVQGYQYKNLLLKLIFAAFMVNFSLVLTQSFLAVAETAQFQFLPQGAEGEKVINVIANELMIAPLNQNTLTPDEASKNLSEGLARLVFPFFYLSLTFMAFVVFVSLAFFLVLRMIVIWILLMASPIAIVATVIPQTKKYATMWLSNLVQYGFFVTILGFFLNVTAYLAQRQEGVLKALGSQGKEASFEEFLSRIATNIFVMGFLVAGLKVAGGMKVIGASSLNKFATKAGKLPFDFLKFGGERLLEGTQNVTGVTVDPRIWKKDWDSYLKRRDEEKAGRLNDRRTGKKGLVGKIPVLKNAGLGSPDDIFENLLTPKGLMKIAKSPKQLLDNMVAKRTKGAADIMTDEQRAEAIQELEKNKKMIPGLTGEIANLANGKIAAGDVNARALMKSALESEHDELSARWQKLEDAKLLLKAEGKGTAAVDGEIARVMGDIKNVESNQALLQNGGELKIDDMIAGAKTDRVKGELKKLSDDIKEKVTSDRDKAQEEVDGFDKKMEADDKLRKKHTFSEYNPKGKASDPNYKEFTEDNRKLAHEVADDYSKSAEKYKFDRLYKTADEEKKKQAEIRKKMEESGAETTDDYISIAKRAVRTGDKDVKEIMSEAFKKAAKEGGAADFMRAFARENRGVSPQAFRDFMQKDMKVIAGMDDKQILKLAFEIGKATSKAKQPNLSYMVQRTGGDLAWNSEKEQQKKAGAAYSEMSTTQFVQLDKSAMYNITVNPGGKEVYTLTDGAKKQWEAMDPSEGKAVISRMSRDQAQTLRNAENQPVYKPATGGQESIGDVVARKAG